MVWFGPSRTARDLEVRPLEVDRSTDAIDGPNPKPILCTCQELIIRFEQMPCINLILFLLLASLEPKSSLIDSCLLQPAFSMRPFDQRKKRSRNRPRLNIGVGKRGGNTVCRVGGH
jgi:hypothetical protein